MSKRRRRREGRREGKEGNEGAEVDPQSAISSSEFFKERADSDTHSPEEYKGLEEKRIKLQARAGVSG